MRVVFLGTPEFAAPTLEALVAAGHEVAAVYTQPDRPKGRGNRLSQSPVKEAAARHGLMVLQPERIRRPENVAALSELKPGAMVVVGYGQIIPQTIIDIPKHGILNVHASLLPKYRGAAPVQWAIANGESETGVTIMQIDAGLDTGDMLLRWRTAIGPHETAPELALRMAKEGAALLTESLRRIENGTARREKQNDAEASYAPILKKEDGLIVWTRPAQEIYNRLRGFTPWPGAYTQFRGQQLQVIRAIPHPHSLDAPSGMVQTDRRRLFVSCGAASTLELLEVQMQGKKRMAVGDFLNGYPIAPNEHLGGNQ
ncbi:MAG TPA: methionyl-tRNA formyltransferase [Bryobacteraceae bacterium]|jgi:methionyl-tRNA formyltransferase|nr:methionyl-tRNA formyltransferase [Bryobacteraceae bacterium]HXR77638.1 methionyl-tRNA formyltransferase [Bryobacteraceae bacterium]